MNCFTSNSIVVSALSATTGNQSILPTDVLFYVNLALVFCALVEFTALIVLYRKTACAEVMGLITVVVFILGLLMYMIQLFVYVYKLSAAEYVVLCSLVVFCLGFVLACVYSIMLSRNSHKALCIIAGIFDFVPPIGAAFTVLLSYKIRRDTLIQSYVYNGYAYTYAALAEFCTNNKAEFIDMAGEEKLEQLDKKQVKRKLKELKAKAVSPAGMFDYAAAVATYMPEKIGRAIKYMRKSADAGHVPALFNLGYYYERGMYVKKDLKKAKSYYSRAAANGDGDAALRLGIIEIETNNFAAGIRIFEQRAQSEKDLCAKFNLGVCAELGLGMAKNVDNALDIYYDCVKAGSFTAQKRMFALAANDINSPLNGDFFRKVTDREFKGSFAVMIDGLIQIKRRHAADAATCFLNAIKFRDKWEGLARCLVGTLYIDCGKELDDKCNGAEYIKSALELLPSAKDVYTVVPSSILRVIRTKEKIRSVRAAK